MLIAFFIFTVSIVVVYSFWANPVYRATAQIVIESQASPLLDLDSGQRGSRLETYYQTEYNRLRSRSLARRVLTNVNLGAELHFPSEDHVDLVLPSAIAGPKTVSNNLLSTDDSRLVDWYLARLQVIPLQNTKLLPLLLL